MVEFETDSLSVLIYDVARTEELDNVFIQRLNHGWIRVTPVSIRKPASLYVVGNLHTFFVEYCPKRGWQATTQP